MRRPAEMLYFIQVKYSDHKFITIYDEGSYYTIEAAECHARSALSSTVKFRIVGYQLMKVSEEYIV